MKKLLVFVYNVSNYSETFIADEIEYINDKSYFEITILHYQESDKVKGIVGVDMPTNFIARFLKSPIKWNLKLLTFKNGNRFVLQYFIPFFKKNQFDLIYCHFGPNGRLIAELKHLGYILPKTKLIVRFHGMDLVRKVYPIGFYQLLRQYADTLIVGTEYARSLLVSYSIPNKKIVMLPVGVKSKYISSQLAVKKYYKIWNIISVGRLVEFKGHLEAVEVMRILRRDGINFKFTIVGSGPSNRKINKLIEIYNLESFVNILSPLDHASTLKLIFENDIYIYTGVKDRNGREETQGLANIEAMAAGLPIISSPVGGIPSYIINNYTGFLCNSENSEHFAARIKWVIKNYETHHLTDIRHNAINLIRLKYTQEMLNMKLFKILANT